MSMNVPTTAELILSLARVADEFEDECHDDPDLDRQHINHDAIAQIMHSVGVLRASILVLEDPSLPLCGRPGPLGRTHCARRAHVGRHFDAYRGWDDPPLDVLLGYADHPS